MGTTACWGTNASFDCEWVYFGYGSRYDMISDYKKGWWLSLDALKVLVQYDYEFKQVHSLVVSGEDSYNHKEYVQDYIDIEKYGFNQYGTIDPEIWKTLPARIRMRMSGIHITGENGESWFDQLVPYSGLFKKNNPEFVAHYTDCLGREHTHPLPGLEDIKKINYNHWEIISRVEFMNEQAKEGCKERMGFFGVMDYDELQTASAEELGALQFD